MERLYIPLSNSNRNQSHQAPPNNPNPPNKAINKARSSRYNLVLFCKTFVRWLATTTFITFVLATLKIYQNKGNFTSHQKANFNVLITALSLCLGLNFFDSFKDLAQVLRWKILKHYEHHARMNRVRKDLILAIESLINVARLAWESRSIPGLCIFCIAWIFLNLLAQTSIALINLTYNMNDGTNWKGTYTRNGVVNATNLTCYFHPKTDKCIPQQDFLQGLAHAYGESPSMLKSGRYDQIDDVVKSTHNYGYFCRNTPGECAYRFVEYNPDDEQRTYPLFTNRTITASTGQCSTYSQTERALPANDTSGVSDPLKFKIFNGSVYDSIIIPRELTGINATTYIYRGVNTPQKATKFSCGNRCVWMWAYINEGNLDNSTFYQCPITISKTSNASSDTHIVSDNVAKLAASSIALEGRLAIENSSTDGSGPDWTQFQFYPSGNEWELPFQNATKAGANMAEFAIRSLSTMAFRNPSVQVRGLVPHLGTRLEVYWKYAIPLCVCIIVVQLALSIFVYLFYVETPQERDIEG